MKIHISSMHFSADSKLKELITSKLEKLSRFYNKITDVEVYLKLENSGQIKDKIVELKALVPGHIIIASAGSKTFESSFDNANQSIIKQLKKRKEKLRVS